MIAKNTYVYINPCLAEDTVPNPQLVLLPRSLTYIPLSLGLNFIQSKIKNTNLGGKKCWLQIHWPISGVKSWLSTDNSFPLLGKSCSIPALAMLASGSEVDGFGVEFGSSWSYLPSQPMPLWTMDAPWEQWDCSCSKRNPGKPEEMLSQQMATVTALSAGKDKSHWGLEGEVQSSSLALLSHN